MEGGLFLLRCLLSLERRKLLCDLLVCRFLAVFILFSKLAHVVHLLTEGYSTTHIAT